MRQQRRPCAVYWLCWFVLCVQLPTDATRLRCSRSELLHHLWCGHLLVAAARPLPGGPAVAGMLRDTCRGWRRRRDPRCCFAFCPAAALGLFLAEAFDAHRACATRLVVASNPVSRNSASQACNPSSPCRKKAFTADVHCCARDRQSANEQPACRVQKRATRKRLSAQGQCRLFTRTRLFTSTRTNI